MNVQEYIASGILEDYLFGLLDADQQRSVEEAIAQYPAIRAAFDQLQIDLEDYAQAQASPLPKGLAKGALARIDAQRNEEPSPQQRLQIQTLIWGGLTLLLTATLAYSVYRNVGLKEDKVQQQVLTDSIQVACIEQAQELEAIRQQLDILRDGSYLPVALNGTDLQKDALATVYYNASSGANYIDILNLPEPPAGKAYQLWTLVPDEDPINMGQVSQAEGFVLRDFPYAEGAIAFAVTLEPASGSEQPTLDQMVLYGTLG